MPPPRASLACCLAPSLSWTGLLAGASVGSERASVWRAEDAAPAAPTSGQPPGLGLDGRGERPPRRHRPGPPSGSHPTPTAPRGGLAVGLGVAAPGGADTGPGPQPPLHPLKSPMLHQADQGPTGQTTGRPRSTRTTGGGGNSAPSQRLSKQPGRDTEGTDGRPRLQPVLHPRGGAVGGGCTDESMEPRAGGRAGV